MIIVYPIPPPAQYLDVLNTTPNVWVPPKFTGIKYSLLLNEREYWIPMWFAAVVLYVNQLASDRQIAGYLPSHEILSVLNLLYALPCVRRCHPSFEQLPQAKQGS